MGHFLQWICRVARRCESGGSVKMFDRFSKAELGACVVERFCSKLLKRRVTERYEDAKQRCNYFCTKAAACALKSALREWSGLVSAVHVYILARIPRTHFKLLSLCIYLVHVPFFDQVYAKLGKKTGIFTAATWGRS